MLSISQDAFDDIYGNLPDIMEIKHRFYSEPQSDNSFVNDYLVSKLWRLNNLYTIVDKMGNRIPFKMRRAQHLVYAKSLEHPRLIILKSRQQGISTLWLVSYFDDCIFYPDFNSGLMAQGLDEAATLLKRLDVLWEELDDSIKNFLGVDKDGDNKKEMTFTNGSAIFIRTSFRSATLQRLHISEFGKIANKYPDRARETKTGTLQAIAQGNTCVIESTAEGENTFKHMWDTAISYAGRRSPKDFMPVFLSWLDDPDCVMEVPQEMGAKETKYFSELEEQLNIKLTNEQKWFWTAQLRELGNDIYQEYPATPEEAFLKDREGTYYASQYLRKVRGRGYERPNLFEPSLPVQVAVDLGRNDYFVLVFFQTFTDGFRIIDCYADNGHGIEHYCNVMKEMEERIDGFVIEHIVLPHDADVTDLSSNMTREEAFWKYGYKCTEVLARTPDVNADIELVRQVIATSLFVDTRAQYIIDCFLNYTKEWDAKREVWKEKPEHNVYSHGADAIRQMVKGGLKYKPKPRRKRSSGGMFS